MGAILIQNKSQFWDQFWNHFPAFFDGPVPGLILEHFLSFGRIVEPKIGPVPGRILEQCVRLF
jgi:hypothetical protein